MSLFITVERMKPELKLTKLTRKITSLNENVSKNILISNVYTRGY